jgi:hypothetical protein
MPTNISRHVYQYQRAILASYRSRSLLHYALLQVVEGSAEKKFMVTIFASYICHQLRKRATTREVQVHKIPSLTQLSAR